MAREIEKDTAQQNISKSVKKTATKKVPDGKKEKILKAGQPVIVESEVTKEELQHTIANLTLQLEQTNMQLDQFAHTTSHELQEPLRKIQTFISKMMSEEKENLTEGLAVSAPIPRNTCEP